MSDRILVTGATGVIGAWVMRELIESGLHPIGVSRGTTDVGKAILGELAGQAEWLTADIEEAWSVSAALRAARPDAIIHMASAKPWQVDAGFVGRADPPAAVRNIVGGTTNMLEAARQFDVRRFVFASSKAVYAPFPPSGDTTEHVGVDHLTRPDTFYGAAKLCGEHLGALYRERFGLEFLAIRFASSYGPFKRGPAHLPTGILSHALSGRRIEVRITEHEYRRIADDYVHNRDVARAFVKACTADDPPVSTFNVGSGVGATVEEIVGTVRRVDPDAPITVVLSDDADSIFPGTVGAHAGVLDISLAERHLGWSPELGLEAGLLETAAFTKNLQEDRAHA